MNDGLKQRVVGAVVLVVLAVIFLPMVFDFRGDRQIDRTSRIPERPLITPVDVPEATRPEGAVYPKSGDKAYQLDASRAEAERLAQSVAEERVEEQVPPEEVIDKPSLNERGLPEGWVIQVGSFKAAEKAESLEKALLSDGYKAYMRHARSQNYYRVYVGPHIDKSDTLAIQQQIDKKYRVKSLLLKFEP